MPRPLPRLLAVLAAATLTYMVTRPGGLANPAREAASAAENQSLWIIVLPWTLSPLLALLCDAVHLGGTRRRSWLLLASGVAVIFWLILASLPSRFDILLAAQLPLSFAMALFQTAENGLAVDVGRRHGATGAVSGIRVMAAQGGVLLLLAVGPVLRDRHLIWTAVLSAMILSVFGWFAAQVLAGERSSRDPVLKPGQAFRTMLRSRSFWISGMFLVLLGAASEGSRLYAMQQLKREGISSQASVPLWISALVVVFGGLAYLRLCRRFALRQLLLVAAGLTATAAVLRFVSGTEPLAIEGSKTLLALASIPLMNLMLRAVPLGLEAFGTALLQYSSAVGAVLGVLLVTVARTSFGLSPLPTLAIFLALSLAGCAAIFALPPELIHLQESDSTHSNDAPLPSEAVL